MRRLCFGGSFNPIHHAHLICARAIAEAGGFDRVVLIPSAQPPHKPTGPQMASPEHRLAMCQIAAALQPDLFEVDDLELRRTGPSYTIDTVRALKQRGWETIHWLIGADMLQLLPAWYHPESLLQETRFVVMRRPGYAIDWSSLPPSFRILESQVVAAPLLEISATDIRRRIAAGESIAYLTPQPVINYLNAHALYS